MQKNKSSGHDGVGHIVSLMYNKSSVIKIEMVYLLYRCIRHVNSARHCNLISQLTNGLEHAA